MYETSLRSSAGPFVPERRSDQGLPKQPKQPEQPERGRQGTAAPHAAPADLTRRHRRQPLLTRLRGWYAGRGPRREQAVRQRAADRLARLGRSWRILDADDVGRRDAMDYLAIGPGGVFTIRVQHHGRTKVLLAGEVIQLNGRRPPYVKEARSEASDVAAALRRATGKKVPVMPVLVFVGSGELSFQGLPRGCIVTSYRELDNILSSRGRFLSPRTVTALYRYAQRHETWLSTAV